MKNLQIEYRKVEELRARSSNPRAHTKKHTEQIAKSLKAFGFVNPILIDEDGCIVAGHGRVAAAKLIGLVEVPVVRLSGMTADQVRAYVIADNRLAELSSWNKEILAVELAYVSDLIDFDPTVTGFELAEIDGAIANGPEKPSKDDILDKVPSVQQRAVTRLGDLWRIGDRHKLICGDSTNPETFIFLLGDEKAATIVSDVPYNVPIAGHVSGLGKVEHREFAMASGEMTSDEFKSFLARTFLNLKKFSIDGSIHYQFIDWRHIGEMLAAGEAVYSELKNICVWAKNNGGMGSFYRSQHELIFVYKSGRAPHINNIELGKNGRFRTNVWNHPGANSFGASRDEDLAMHPTVKPVALVYDAILDCSRPKDIVLDPFAGSGTTLVAAQKAKRRGYGVELDPLYCDVILRRMQQLFGMTPILAADGRSFDDIAQDRLADDREDAA